MFAFSAYIPGRAKHYLEDIYQYLMRWKVMEFDSFIMEAEQMFVYGCLYKVQQEGRMCLGKSEVKLWKHALNNNIPHWYNR